MAASAGIDLHDRGARAADALAVIGGRLVAFDYVKRHFAGKIADRALEQCGLAAAGRTDEVERKNLTSHAPRPVPCRRCIVLGKDPRLHIDNAYARMAVGVVRMEMVVAGLSMRGVVMVVVTAP